MILTFKTPVVSLDTCRSVLGRGEDACLELIEAGRLRYAFNLATPGTHRRLVRVLSLSLIDCALGTDSQPPTLEGAIRYILPGSSPILTAAWMARHFNVGGSHIGSLLNVGELAETSPWDRSPNKDRLLSRSSAVKFLENRRCA